MSTSNTPLTAEQATINRLEARCKMLRAERNTAREAAERNMKWLQERNEEVDQLKQRIAELEK